MSYIFWRCWKSIPGSLGKIDHMTSRSLIDQATSRFQIDHTISRSQIDPATSRSWSNRLSRSLITRYHTISRDFAISDITYATPNFWSHDFAISDDSIFDWSDDFAISDRSRDFANFWSNHANFAILWLRYRRLKRSLIDRDDFFRHSLDRSARLRDILIDKTDFSPSQIESDDFAISDRYSQQTLAIYRSIRRFRDSLIRFTRTTSLISDRSTRLVRDLLIPIRRLRNH